MARLSRRRAAALVAVALVAGVGVAAFLVADRGDRPAEPATTRRAAPPARPAALVPIRPRDSRLCRASRLLRPICPRRVPAALYPRRGAYLAPQGRAGERYDRFELIALPSRRGPPHLALFASRYGLDGVFAKPARPLGRATWAGARGRLVLDRSQQRAGDHVVFRWTSRGVEYAVALAVWGPVRDAVATLRATVASGTSPGRAGVPGP